MAYVYHLKPEPFLGEELIPLNQMPKGSALYQTHARKYRGREALAQVEIPLLDCLWNDVVQFSLLNPQIIVEALREVNPLLKIHRPQYFKVPIELLLKQAEAVVFRRREERTKGDFSIDASEVCPLTYDTEELKAVPQATRDYWEREARDGGTLLWFAFVPHVLARGRVNTSDFELCDIH